MSCSCVAASITVRGFGAWALSTFSVVLLAACGGGGVGSQPQLVAAASPSSDLLGAPSLPATRSVSDGAFATSLLCADCHVNAADSDAMRDSANRPIAPLDLWRSSMMSNAVRDPFYRAVVSAEMAAAPTMAEAIETKCLSCHGPMASREGQGDGLEPSLGMVYDDSDRAQILLDGVSCTLCHQITSAGLGTDASYAGQYELNTQREAYGPHARPRETPMEGRSGYRPVRAAHNGTSALCGTCHTVLTEALDAGEDPTGIQFLEQTAYLEWRNSLFNDEVASPAEEAASCQACHVPTVSEDGDPTRTAIASVRGMTGGGRGYRWRRGGGGGGMVLPDRAPFGRHVYVGGNTAVLRMLLADRDELNPNATPEAFRATIRTARQALQSNTARLRIHESARMGDQLRIQLRVENLVGHKLPTGIPVRRMWIRVRLLDADGNVAFVSGSYDASGRILGADGTPLSSEEVSGPTEPHRDQITDPDQVQIYEAVMADSDGVLTFRLMRAASFLKDNRLLPLGWSRDHAEAARTAPHGGATQDANFTAGQDTVLYRIHAPASGGPYRLEASLLYQPIGQRFAAELLQFTTPEIDAFARYFTPDVRVPEELVTLSQEVP